MAQRESKLSRKIQDALRARGVFVFKVHGSEFMMAGLPDLVACAWGQFVGLEVKNPGSRADRSRIQKHRAEQIARAGGVATVVTSVREALEIVDSLKPPLS